MVDGTGLENRHTRKGIGGSNPSLSAVVLVAGREERHAEGAYYREWREGTKRVRRCAGKDAQYAATQQLKKESELNARNYGVAIAPETANGRSLSAAIVEYLEETQLSKKPKTYVAYSTASLRYFQESCSKTNLEDLDRKDLLKFSAFLRDGKDQSARTVNVKFGRRNEIPVDQYEAWLRLGK